MLVVFDLDGTLVDSRRDLAEAANQLIAEYGGMPIEETAVGRMIGEGAALLVERALAAAGLEHVPQRPALQRFLEIYERRMLVHTRPYPGVVDVLDACRSRAELALLTNKPAESTRQMLEALDLRRYFGEVVCGDGPFGRKPGTGGLDHLFAWSKTAREDAVLVGDSHIDVETAVAGGIRVYVARYGFGFHDFPVTLLEAVDGFLDRPADLVPMLDRFAASGSRSGGSVS